MPHCQVTCHGRSAIRPRTTTGLVHWGEDVRDSHRMSGVDQENEVSKIHGHTVMKAPVYLVDSTEKGDLDDIHR